MPQSRSESRISPSRSSSRRGINRYQAEEMVKRAFPNISYSENSFANVKGEKSPYDGDINYWSKRNSVLYDGSTAKTLRRQNHSCGRCGLKFINDEKVELHHIDGNHHNWKAKNLSAIHSSCHHYVHMSKGRKDQVFRKPSVGKPARSDFTERGEA